MKLLRVIRAFARMCVRVLRQGGANEGSRALPRLPSSFQSLSAKVFAEKDAPQGELFPPPESKRPSSLFMRMGFKTRVALGLIVATVAGVSAALAGMMIYYTIVFPDPLAVRDTQRPPVIKILARDGSLLAIRGSSREYVPLDTMPKYMQEAVVATEDRRFFVHHGVDPAGMIRAMFANLRAGRFAQGGSTLTQQLAKNLFLTPDRTLARKFAEFGLALWLELRLSKEQILEVYLNRVYLGRGAYGVEAASQRYFGKPASKMTLAECAVIAGLLKAPSRYSPATSPDAALTRSRVVLAAMVDAGYISVDDARRAADQKMLFAQAKAARTDDGDAYAVDFILEQIPPLPGSGHDLLVVETTIDSKLQHAAQKIVTENIAKKGPALSATQAAAVVLDNNGGVRAIVGGRDYQESQYDRAVKSRRQPGSAFKPFVYLAALEHGMTPDTIVSDRPVAIAGWSPKNDDGNFAGEITLRQALSQSINTVAAQIYQTMGRGTAIELATRLGIKSELRDSPSLALGTSEVSLLELAGAYTVFANGGYADQVHTIERVRDGAGHMLFAWQDLGKSRLVDAGHIGDLNDMMNAAVVWGTGKRAAFGNFPVGGKTGTTQDFRDAWFVGYTSYLTGGVWVGNDNSQPMNRAMGGGLPAEIWSQVMRAAHQGLTPMPLAGTEISVGADDVDPAWTMPTSSRGVRVVSAGDRLPWLHANDSPNEPGVPRKFYAPVSRTPAGTPHPDQSIGDDFVARALAGTLSEGRASSPDGAAPQPR